MRKEARALAGTDTSSLFTLTTPTVLGDTLILKIWTTAAAAPTTIVDSAGGSLAGGQWVLVGSGPATFVYARFNCPAGITTVLPSFGAADYLNFLANHDNVLSVDKVTIVDAAAQTTPTCPTTGVLSFANEVVYGFFDTFSGNAQNFAAVAPFAAVTGTGLTGGAWAGSGTQAFVESREVSATTAQAPSATCDSSYVYSMCITFRITAPVVPGGVVNNDRLGIKLGIGI